MAFLIEDAAAQGMQIQSEEDLKAYAQQLGKEGLQAKYQEFMQRMQMQGISEEMYYQYTNSSKEDITKQMKEDAVKRVKYRYLLKEIIKVEKIKVSDKDAKARVKEMATMYNVDEETILKEVSLENVKFDLMYQKALDLVTTNKEEK
jgi:trigger factor